MQDEKLKTHSVIDKLLNGGIENGIITNIYGPAGSGKSNICLISVLATLRTGKKVIYIDTEGSFSFERFSQIGGLKSDLDNIIFHRPMSWEEQDKTLTELKHSEGVGLIIVDSLVALYRIQLTNENYKTINNQLATQYSLLSAIARKNQIPVIVTNQVYANLDDNGKTKMTSSTIANFWSKTVVELENKGEKRKATVKKHRAMPQKSIEFTIIQTGLKAL